MKYNRCGKSGLRLPAVSLGLWHNFGSNASFDNMQAMCCTAFDNGITHFDLANNYGPVYGAAEEIAELGATSFKDLGKVMKAITPKIKGVADGKVVSNIVKNILMK